MCGIAGAIRLDGAAAPPLSDQVLNLMTEEIRYRGPDDAGFVQADGCSLGARRLSIIDVEGGHQPFFNETGRVWAAQNGEIYNHDGLREMLRSRGHVLRSRCDTEVLPHLYEEFGPAMTEHLRGMYAFAVWDGDRRTGVLVRDRLGVKPLYYAHVGDVIVFGSELKSVIASGLVSPTLDAEAISAYLTLGFIPAPMTPLKDVRKLNPGERLLIENGHVRIERYWNYPAPNADPVRRSADEWAEIVLAKLDESVQMRLMADVPLGAMLSGGLDSSLIVALMARHMDQPVDTFSVGFPGEGSELPAAREVAAFNSARHHELQVEISTGIDDLRRLIWHMDEPLADLSSVGFLALCELAVNDVTVALSGQGADELFGGYRKHRVASLAQHWQRMPAAMRGSAAKLLAHGPGRAGRLVDALQAPDPVARLLASSQLVQPELRGGVFGGALAEHAEAAERIMHGHMAGAPGAAPLEAAMFLDAKLGLVDDMLTYFDRASMAKSLEVRVPFLDHELVELAATVPSSVKVNRLRGKHVLKLAAKGLVPDFVLDKRKQGFFNEAVPAWIGAEGGATVERVLLSGDPAYASVVDRDAVETAVRATRAGDGRHAPFLLSMIMLELWLSEYLPRAFALADDAEKVAA